MVKKQQSDLLLVSFYVMLLCWAMRVTPAALRAALSAPQIKPRVFYWVHMEEVKRLPSYSHQELPLVSLLEGHSGTVREVPNQRSPKASGSKQGALQLLGWFILCRLNLKVEIKPELETESTRATCGPWGHVANVASTSQGSLLCKLLVVGFYN